MTTLPVVQLSECESHAEYLVSTKANPKSFTLAKFSKHDPPETFWRSEGQYPASCIAEIRGPVTLPPASAPALPEPPVVRVSGVWREGEAVYCAMDFGDSVPQRSQIVVAVLVDGLWERHDKYWAEEFRTMFPSFPGWLPDAAACRAECETWKARFAQADKDIVDLQAECERLTKAHSKSQSDLHLDLSKAVGLLSKTKHELSSLRARVGEIAWQIEQRSKSGVVHFSEMDQWAKDMRAIAKGEPGKEPQAYSDPAFVSPSDAEMIDFDAPLSGEEKLIAALTTERDKLAKDLDAVDKHDSETGLLANRLEKELAAAKKSIQALAAERDELVFVHKNEQSRADRFLKDRDHWQAEHAKVAAELAKVTRDLRHLMTQACDSYYDAKRIVTRFETTPALPPLDDSPAKQPAAPPARAVVGPCGTCGKPIYEDDDYRNGGDGDFFHQICFPDVCMLPDEKPCPLRLSLKLSGNTVSGKVLEQAEEWRSKPGWSGMTIAEVPGFYVASSGIVELQSWCLYVLGRDTAKDVFSCTFDTLPEAIRVYRSICECVAKIGGVVEKEFAEGPPKGDREWVVLLGFSPHGDRHYALRTIKDGKTYDENGVPMKISDCFKGYLANRPATPAEIEKKRVIE